MLMLCSMRCKHDYKWWLKKDVKGKAVSRVNASFGYQTETLEYKNKIAIEVGHSVKWTKQ